MLQKVLNNSYFILYIEIAIYCSSTAPTITNANAPTPVTTVFSLTSFTCSAGYQSSGGATAPYYQCLPGTSATGVWSNPSYTCIRT